MNEFDERVAYKIHVHILIELFIDHDPKVFDISSHTLYCYFICNKFF